MRFDRSTANEAERYISHGVSAPGDITGRETEPGFQIPRRPLYAALQPGPAREFRLHVRELWNVDNVVYFDDIVRIVSGCGNGYIAAGHVQLCELQAAASLARHFTRERDAWTDQARYNALSERETAGCAVELGGKHAGRDVRVGLDDDVGLPTDWLAHKRRKGAEIAEDQLCRARLPRFREANLAGEIGLLVAGADVIQRQYACLERSRQLGPREAPDRVRQTVLQAAHAAGIDFDLDPLCVECGLPSGHELDGPGAEIDLGGGAGRMANVRRDDGQRDLSLRQGVWDLELQVQFAKREAVSIRHGKMNGSTVLAGNLRRECAIVVRRRGRVAGVSAQLYRIGHKLDVRDLKPMVTAHARYQGSGCLTGHEVLDAHGCDGLQIAGKIACNPVAFSIAVETDAAGNERLAGCRRRPISMPSFQRSLTCKLQRQARCVR